MDRKLRKEEKKKAKLEKLEKKNQRITIPKMRNYNIGESLVDNTVPGEKKDLSVMPDSYDPKFVESSWYSWWQKMGFFTPEYMSPENEDFIEKNESSRASAPNQGDSSRIKDTFTILMPPPNITGKLHIGHSMMVALQDTLVRYKRMLGYRVLYLPGTDHAGISTQSVVEKSILKSKGMTRYDLTREEFLKHTWAWKEEYGGAILEQIKRLGASCDFGRLRFTLDEKTSRAVTEAFNRLYKRGLIYRDNRLVNWCSKLGTTLSDLEVESLPVSPFMKYSVDGSEYKFGMLYYFKYPIKPLKQDLNNGNSSTNNENQNEIRDLNCHEYIEIATTRPETILGDTAICVNPKDTRYVKLKGRFALNPLTGTEIPIIFDEKADPEFGTGALKITPAHDHNDYEIGKRHNLPFIQIFDDGNRIIVSGPFKGLKRYDARVKIVSYLKEKQLLTRIDGHEQTLPICSRSGDIVEPILKKQWFLKCDSMAKKALEAVKSGTIKIYPPEAAKTWYHWLENIHDWCLSRQLWWGHRIPAYRVFENESKLGWVVACNEEEAKNEAKKMYGEKEFIIYQDEDVLDTWFSSGLWPFSVFSWPEETIDLQKFFPSTLLETGSDILFFWVARMVMLSLELTETPPFREILLHGIIRDAHGRKMSKSLGNVIDPIFVIEGISSENLRESLYTGNLDPREIKKAADAQKKDFPNGIPICGADALRFTLLSYTSGLKDVNMNILHVEGYRKFCNKIWNAFKFVKNILLSSEITSEDLKLFKQRYMSDKIEDQLISININSNSNDPAIEWLLYCRNILIKNIKIYLDTYNFLAATREIHNFLLYTFCDIYIELIKKKTTPDMISCLYVVFMDAIKILHPFIPFITEEIYQRMRINIEKLDESITISEFPKISTREVKNDYSIVPKVIKIIRSILNHQKITKCSIQTNYPKEFITDIKYLSKSIIDVKITSNIKSDILEQVGDYQIGIKILDENNTNNNSH